MDLRKVRKLIEIFNESKLGEIEIREADETIRLTRSVPLPAADYRPHPATDIVVPTEPVAVSPPARDDADEAAPFHPVTSPMVGTFYAAASPDDDPFAKVGDPVEVGQNLCLIEAMKIYNEIESDKAGTIIQVLKSNGDPVEFGETLFLLSE